jgi:NMD protein affecting ribosome stability and mRNA decay
METRVCCSCGESKSVAGIWYLVGEGSDGFMCGACFSRSTGTVKPDPGVVQQR